MAIQISKRLRLRLIILIVGFFFVIEIAGDQFFTYKNSDLIERVSLIFQSTWFSRVLHAFTRFNRQRIPLRKLISRE